MQSSTGIMKRQVVIPAGRHALSGTLSLPSNAAGVVVFAHGSGSARFSPRNQFVAGVLQAGGLATLLIDLLDVTEAEFREKVFDIELLAEPVQAAAGWLRRDPDSEQLQIGYFGASTGAAAALVAAGRQPDAVAAVVSRGGRPDLAADTLPSVQAPTLLIVGGNDDVVITLNQEALNRLRCQKELVIIPGATHLFPEPRALEEVARLAQCWFTRYLITNRSKIAGNRPHI